MYYALSVKFPDARGWYVTNVLRSAERAFRMFDTVDPEGATAVRLARRATKTEVWLHVCERTLPVRTLAEVKERARAQPEVWAAARAACEGLAFTGVDGVPRDVTGKAVTP